MNLKIFFLVESLEAWMKTLEDLRAAVILHHEDFAYLNEDEFQEVLKQFPETYHEILKEEYEYAKKHKRLFKRYVEV